MDLYHRLLEIAGQTLSSSSGVTPLGATALCLAISGLSISAARKNSSRPVVALGADAVCCAIMSRALLWLLATAEGRALVLNRLIWCVPGMSQVGTVIPLVFGCLVVLVLLDRLLQGYDRDPTTAPPPRSLSFFNPLRGLASLLVVMHHTVILYFTGAFISVDVATLANMRLPYSVTWLRHPAVQLLWGHGPLTVRLFSLIAGRLIVVRFLRGSGPESLVRSMLRRYCHVYACLLATLTGHVAIIQLGGHTYLAEAGTIARSAELSNWGKDKAGLTLRQCLELVPHFMSLDPRTIPIGFLRDLWTLPGHLRASMYILAVTSLLFTLRLPLRLAVYAGLYVLVPRLPDSATAGAFLLGLAVADVDETSTALRRLPLSKARAVQLGLGVLRAYLLVIWATGQGQFYGGSGTVMIPDLRREEGAVCLFVFLHLTPSVCGALEGCWPLQALGRLSVGLWLFHSIVLSSAGAAVLVWLHGHGMDYNACVAGVFIATVAISLVLSSIFNTIIERPLETCLGYVYKLVFMEPAPRASPSAKDVRSDQVSSRLEVKEGNGTQ